MGNRDRRVGGYIARQNDFATPIAMPRAFRFALAKNKKAKANYAFPPSHKREYLQWITEAKREETRDRRIAEAVEWIAAGKPRNWKYM